MSLSERMHTFVVIIKLAIAGAIAALVIFYLVVIIMNLFIKRPNTDDLLWAHRMMLHDKALEDRNDLERHSFGGKVKGTNKKAH